MAAWLFARALSLIYLIAFVSIGVQVRGLIGANGILPAENFVHIVDRYFGAKKFVSLPSVFLFGVNDQLLVLVCAAGAVCALLAFAGVAQSLMFLLMWALYLSLVNVSQDFLSFQWDVLLLEAGFLAIFLAPVTAVDLNPAAAFFKAHEPPRLVYWLFLFLLFRFMFASGAVKLASGDETWRNLTAMSYHYETQPIPNPLAWLAHQLPLWAQKLSCAAMFAIELAVPFLIFVPGRARLLAFGSLVALQTLILATGNYAFFNWLTIALCLFLLPE
ncbi:MAG TPA: lipase maturation factor family protein, partial [Bdellovibrionales bacterium]|nr:lipase maturation factor family protein [Bdellovibrionales bacterium]